MSPVDDNFEDELPEPVSGHEEVPLLASILSPGVLHSPAGHAAVILYMAPGQHLWGGGGGTDIYIQSKNLLKILT